MMAIGSPGVTFISAKMMTVTKKTTRGIWTSRRRKYDQMPTLTWLAA